MTLIPRISIRYNFNDNIYALSPDYIDDWGHDSASSMDYQAGLLFRWIDGRNAFELSGDAGYEQFIALGDFFDGMNVSPSDYDFVTGQAGINYKYTGRVFSFRLDDKFNRSMDLQRVFGMSTDAMGYGTLFTYNNATFTVGYSPNPRSRNSLGYAYDTLTFDDPENIAPFELSDSGEHRLLYHSEYDFTPKTTGIIDFQAANHFFTDLTLVDSANYNLYMAMLGLRFNLRPATYLEILGGVADRDIYDQPKEMDLLSSLDAVGHVAFVTNQANRYRLTLYGERSISTYGTNLFFVYNGVGVTSQIWAAPKLSFKLNGTYRQALFDTERNDREDTWKNDRVDYLTNINGAILWDIMQKNGEGTLSLEAGYGYQLRDSNLDASNDYVGNPTNFWIYDTTINSYYVQLQIKPTILFGNR